MTAKIIQFPTLAKMDNVSLIEQVATMFRERATPTSESVWSQKELLVALWVSLRLELKITERDIRHFGTDTNDNPIRFVLK